MMEPLELNCYEGYHWVHWSIAMFTFIFIGIVFPFMLYKTIGKYMPRPQYFNELGEKINMDDNEDEFIKQYQDLLARDTCPYCFLYQGFEYGWSFYKVVTMLMKVCLVLPMIPFFKSPWAAVTINLLIVLLYAILSGMTRPFLLPQDDYIDLSARVTSVLILIVQFLVIGEVIDNDMAGIVLIVINIANVGIMGGVFIFNMSLIKNFKSIVKPEYGSASGDKFLQTSPNSPRFLKDSHSRRTSFESSVQKYIITPFTHQTKRSPSLLLLHFSGIECPSALSNTYVSGSKTTLFRIFAFSITKKAKAVSSNTQII
jgi:hypothetical protein